MDRRQFLLNSFFGGAALLTRSSFAHSNLNGVLNPQFDCIVVGAGMAGITAAKEVAFPRYESSRKVLVLEASGRIGGRIHTVRDSRFSGPLELGATFVHIDPKTFPIGNDFDQYQVTLKKIPRLFTGLLYFDGWENNFRREYEMVKEWNLYDLLSFSKKIDSYRGEDIPAKKWLDHQNYSTLGREMVDLYLTGHAPGTLDELSMIGFGADKYSQVEMGANEYAQPEGFSNFLKKMTKGLGHHNGKEIEIQTGKVVNHIQYGLDGVRVTTESGEEFTARTAVIAVSVGVLKSQRIQFDPPLPSEKIQALRNLEMGDEAKMILQFNKRFWPSKTTFINRVDTRREMGRTYHIPFAFDERNNNTLAVLFAGAEANKIRFMSDHDVIRALCRDFDLMFPNDAPTYDLLRWENGSPVYVRYQWSENPFTLGADSYLKYTGAQKAEILSARRILSRPFSTPGLFWAGEATATGDDIHPACSHGAHFSGMRAGVEVAQFLRRV